MALIAWLITLITGRLPASFHLAYVAVLRFQTRFYGYQWMLTTAYPGGLYGDGPGMVAWADAPAPAFGAPAPGYGTAGGWGAPGGYGAPATTPRAGTARGRFPARHRAAPADVRGKGLITTFIVLGAICLVGQNVYNRTSTTVNNNRTSTSVVIDL